MGIRVEEGGDWEGLSAPSLSCSPRDKKGTREKFMKAEAASYSRALGRKEGSERISSASESSTDSSSRSRIYSSVRDKRPR